MIAVLATSLAAATPSTLVYVGPQVPAAQFEQVFDEAIAVCGLQRENVKRSYAMLREQPATAVQRATQESEVRDIARRAGFLGPESEHQISYEMIRVFLQTRTFLRLAMTASPRQAECITQWLRSQNFAPIGQGQQLPDELRD